MKKIFIALFAIASVACGADLMEIAARQLTGIQRPDPVLVADAQGNITGDVLGHSAVELRSITNRADVLALAAADDAAATAPRVEPNGIEVPVLVLQSSTNQYGIGLIASDSGDIITYIDHQSPRPSPSVLAARIKAEVDAQQDRREKLRNIADRMQNTASLSTNQTTAAQQGKQIEDIANDVRRLARIMIRAE